MGKKVELEVNWAAVVGSVGVCCGEERVLWKRENDVERERERENIVEK